MSRARSLRTRAGLLILCAAFAASVAEAALLSADAVKAAYLYRFASYVEWPEDAPSAGPFIVAVVGAEAVAKQLEGMARRVTVAGRPVQVRRISRPTELAGVQILYVGPRAFARSRPLRQAAISLPILLVTDNRFGLDGGGVINFTALDKDVRFEVSLVAADRSRLKISSALLSVAARVERRPQAAMPCTHAVGGGAGITRCSITVAAQGAGSP